MSKKTRLGRRALNRDRCLQRQYFKKKSARPTGSTLLEGPVPFHQHLAIQFRRSEEFAFDAGENDGQGPFLSFALPCLVSRSILSNIFVLNRDLQFASEQVGVRILNSCRYLRPRFQTHRRNQFHTEDSLFALFPRWFGERER